MTIVPRQEIRAKYGVERPSLINHFKRSNPEFARILKRFSSAVGYDFGMWSRQVMYQTCRAKLEAMNLGELDVMEIAAGDFWRELPFKSFASMNYPEYDITKDALPRTFDLIIADNVFEHLSYPHRAACNVLKMLRPGGTFLNITPFMVRVHNIPIDCTRWTELGMKYFLIEAGFDPDGIETGAWGNRAVVKSDFTRWSRRGFWGSLKNEPRFPIQVWAFARAPRVSPIP